MSFKEEPDTLKIWTDAVFFVPHFYFPSTIFLHIVPIVLSIENFISNLSIMLDWIINVIL